MTPSFEDQTAYDGDQSFILDGRRDARGNGRRIASAVQPCGVSTLNREEGGCDLQSPAIPGRTRILGIRKSPLGRWMSLESNRGVKLTSKMGNTFPRTYVYPATPSRPVASSVVDIDPHDNEIPDLLGQMLAWHTMETPHSCISGGRSMGGHEVTDGACEDVRGDNVPGTPYQIFRKHFGELTDCRRRRDIVMKRTRRRRGRTQREGWDVWRRRSLRSY